MNNRIIYYPLTATPFKRNFVGMSGECGNTNN